ncbi:MAG: D-mannonate epimerase [Spirochaetia bacterium]|jgi:hypothetical protein|nr:D-mannonate epimerase [Spirochaetia bacterium]
MDIDECVHASGSATASISDKALARDFIEALESIGPRHRVLAIPPDGLRSQGRADVLLKAAYDYYGDSLAAVMPALGRHRPMGDAAIQAMYPGVPLGLFRPHDWKRDVIELGRVPDSFVREVSDNRCTFDWPAQANRLAVNGGFDLIMSIGQVVPHESVGMANYSDNLFIGVGGKEGIDRAHWIGAAYGIENIMGRIETPVRAVLDHAQELFASSIPMLYALTVVGRGQTKGLFVGSGRDSFAKAGALSSEVNVEYLPKAAKKIVVFLDPERYKSTWVGNRAIYRTRLAIADGGELLIVAPGIDSFGEDKTIDETIRDYGYCGVAMARELVESGELAGELAGASHLANGSTEGRFSVSYAAGGLSRTDIEDVGYDWADCQDATRRYDPELLKDGFNEVDGEEIYFVRDPALGLWATRASLGKA